ncbi:MAG: multidrug resistance efflux transporter family protein [Vicinamibacterales bacterium]
MLPTHSAPGSRFAILVALLASSCFSVTFIVNRAIGVAGGHWVWTAALRYAWVLLLLSLWFVMRWQLGGVLRAFRAHWLFWTVAGTVGVGLFYAPLAYAPTLAPGWVVACTMQFTILATPLVLLMFGARVRRSGVLLLAIIFAGIVLVNLDRRDASATVQVLGVLPVVLSAFAYPFGNQLLQEARSGGGRWIPRLDDEVTANATARVLLMTIGSIPFWLLTLLLPHSPAPTRQQVAGTLIVALFGTIGNALFLFARQMGGRDPNAVARVDATQSSYTAMTLLGEVVLLNTALPGAIGFAGLVLVLGGLAFYTIRTGS